MTVTTLPVADWLPAFADLPVGTEGIDRVAWGIFGEADELGTVNLLDATAVLRGVREVRTGQVHSLNWNAALPDPGPWRREPRRVEVTRSPLSRDDYVEHFHLQYSTQWDGLRHVGLPSGFYNGIAPEIVEESERLGIHSWAEHGIAGRGVLLDLVRMYAEKGRVIDHSSSQTFTCADLDDAATRQGVTFEPGDILLVRTGWIMWYESLDAEERSSLDAETCVPGLEPSVAMARWIWDHHLAAVATDNVAVEPLPLHPDFPLRTLHGYLIAGFGMPMGELFKLDDLATSCAAQGRWTFFVTSAPLNFRGAVGSPGNMLALL